MRLFEVDTAAPSLLFQADERLASVLLRRRPGEDYMHIGVEWPLALLVCAAAFIRYWLGQLLGYPEPSWTDPELAVWWGFALLVLATGSLHSFRNRRLRRAGREVIPTRFIGYSIFLSQKAMQRAGTEMKQLKVLRRSYWIEFLVLAAIGVAFCLAGLSGFGLYLMVVAFILLNNSVAIVGNRLQERKELLNAMYLKARQAALLEEIDGGRTGLGTSVPVD